jgi:glycosyltransferase involved in cell wall biosynthesis
VRIAQVAPLYESVPPKLYGGTERVVSFLTEELVAQGHDVTLYASGDSVTSARLEAACPSALRLATDCVDQLAHHVLMVERVARDAQAGRYDLVHFHCDYLHFPVSRRAIPVHLTTLHGRLDLPDLRPLYREFDDAPLVSVSDAQRRPLPDAGWRGTVHHGLPLDLLPFRREPSGYLAFLGRISPEKGADRAIEIARRAGLPLRLAAKVDRVDRDYFRERIRPLLEGPGVEFVGELGDADKADFLGGARALLFPIDWPEPFGLVMIEAMACGTPVVAFDRGAVPEVIEDGVNGFRVEDVAGAVGAVARLGELSRARCRARFEERFGAPRMARDYVALYRRLVEAPRGPRARLRLVPPAPELAAAAATAPPEGAEGAEGGTPS